MIKPKTMIKKLIKFCEESHTYYVDDKVVPSTTNLVSSILGNNYENVDKKVMKEASEYGTKVHEEISKWLVHPSEEMEFETIEARNVIKFLIPRLAITPLASENMVGYENDKGQIMLGTLDMFYGRHDKESNSVIHGLCDFKTTSAYMEQYVETQLNFYLLAFEQQTGIEIKELSCIHVKGTTRKFRPVKIDRKKYKDLLDKALGEWYGNSK